jgi:uncharacterized membrane protein YuzA (DUF378 family)/vacuolar-type H+-ATPase subunit H
MYKLIIQILVIAGAINWGLIAFQNTDLVKSLVGTSQIEKYIKLAIGAAGLYYAYMIYNNESIENFMTADSSNNLIKNTEHFAFPEQVLRQIKEQERRILEQTRRAAEEKKEQDRRAQEQIKRIQEQAQEQARKMFGAQGQSREQDRRAQEQIKRIQEQAQEQARKMFGFQGQNKSWFR